MDGILCDGNSGLVAGSAYAVLLLAWIHPQTQLAGNQLSCVLDGDRHLVRRIFIPECCTDTQGRSGEDEAVAV